MWLEAQMRGKHHVIWKQLESLTREGFPNLKVQKRVCKRTDLPLGARNASKLKIVEACLRSNCSVARREVLQSVHLGGCNRSEPEMRCVWPAVCLWL